MGVVFADTGYWIALWNPRDALHQKAMAFADALESSAVVTDSYVEVIPQTDAQFRAAVERYAARSDQTWSLTDCASFLVMEERGITEALAYDRDFEQAGFVALLREGQA